LDLRPQDSETARIFFEENFQPVRIARLGEVEGGTRNAPTAAQVVVETACANCRHEAHAQGAVDEARRWMTAHPDEAAKARAANRSYVFFRITGLSNEGEPVGAQGVPLTPGRSIAVDRLHDYGTPFFIEANLPIESAKPVSPFRRLMVAQDTGSAIVGPARADFYWGAGDYAARIAGRIRHPGRFVMLLPRELDMIAAGKHMPLPLPKPKFAEVEFRKHNGKGNANSAKSEVDPRAATAYARWRYQPSY
jgi:membrane-bound lytic murein transglycosylase A